ncbi:DUF4139 domain-containing protein [Deinococcus maricopensis]|uniref:DUF4139 domain-containing protein n=1 Tax=Deinococcus maricopensis (strain DSM 21211 / LMG 22137 / NRRL B-23946 / LB-34) TaxID=709986 RepID=E8U9E4_DEIML|nr:DUF4139 domain-containing protein [Deinococcus maricopensis]ADV67683.1 hypothetical protein Deima_2040 [Deinococcus maricopensis DSM 21211]
MLKHLLTAALLTVSAASATDLRIYPSFTEVRESVRAATPDLTLTLPANTYGSIIPGTLDVDGLNVLQAVLTPQATWLKSQEGKEVTLREDGQEQRVTLVRASDLLIRDAQGRYRNVQYTQLAFDALPPENPQQPQQQVALRVAAPGNGTLSYLTRAITWTPRYTLKINGSAAALSAMADIRNNTDTPYTVQNTELFAGDVDVQGGGPVPAPYMARGNVALAAADVEDATKISSLGELRGLYRYGLSAGFTLPASSTVSLAFLQPKVTFERYAGLNTYFGTEARTGTLSRFYRVKADTQLPGGPLTVREDGRIVGQTNINETPKGENVDFTLGADPDMTYTRAVQTTRQDKDGSVYRVTYTFKNAKTDRSVRAEVRENLPGNVTVDGAERSNDGRLVLKADVPANGQVSKTFTVTIKNS